MSKNNFQIITLKKKNIKDFAVERNILLREAKSEWVFFLDSDEKMPKKLTAEINKKIKSADYEGFYVFRKNYFLGRYAGTDRIIRLGRRRSGKWFRAVHEIWRINGRVGELKNPITHNTADTVYGMVEKINSYSSLHAEENIKEGKQADIFKIVFYPKFKFIQSIISGRGIVLSILQAFHSFLAWSKQWEIQN